MHKTKLLPERGINLDKVEEKLLGFHARLTKIGWRCFALDTYYTNNQWVREFYASLSVTFFINPVMNIRGKQINFETEQIHEVYRVPNANMEQFHKKIMRARDLDGKYFMSWKKGSLVHHQERHSDE